MPDALKMYLDEPEPRSFEALVRATATHTREVARKVCGPRRELADDVTQEVYLKLLRLRRPPGEIRSSAGYLASLTRFTATKALRAERRRRRVVKPDNRAILRARAGGLSPPERFELKEALLALPDELRRSVELRYIYGLSTAEIAGELGVSRRQVQKRLRVAFARLREGLSRFGEPEAGGRGEDGEPEGGS